MSTKQSFYTKVKVSNMKELLKKQKKPSSGSKQELFNRLSVKNLKILTNVSTKTSASVKKKNQSNKKRSRNFSNKQIFERR